MGFMEVLGSIEVQVVLSGYYPIDCQVTPFEVRVSPVYLYGDG